ncbi:MAG TPA: hypothetical protein VHW72_19925 [Candidatus Angelobacter sp.]|nr:hypothetical protein [Candidatus Angelobacter sp.]
MLCPQTNTTLVGRLRIRSRSSDPQAEQQRIERMLRSATLHPSGLPESATLVVRRLADPLPSRLRAGPYDLLPDASWQRAVTASLEKLAASAARPAYGAVPAETDAVLFYDRAEVLAALALAWISGTLPAQWWWREFLRGRDSVTTLLLEWSESPQYVPGALDLLAKRARAVQFVQRIPQLAASEILEAVLIAFNVPRPVAEDTASQKIAENRAAAQQQVASTARTQKGPRVIALHPPFRRWVPEADTPALLPTQSMLLIQALMLRRAPAVARTAAFQKDLRWWQAAVESVAASEDRETEEIQAELPHWASQEKPAAPEMPVATAGQEAGGGSQPAPLPGAAPEHHAEKVVAAEPVLAATSEILDTAVPGAAPPSQQPAIANESTSFEDPLQPRRMAHQAPALPQGLSIEYAAGREETQPERASEPVTTLETEYGGVFFLLSLALYLYIYGDFTSPAKPGLELNIWDFLALMAFELTDGEIEKDPLWAELASLSGRPKSVRAGLGFDPPDEWRVSAEWLAAFAENYVPQPALSNGRMISMHPAGFIAVDVPAETSVADGVGEPFSGIDRLQRWVGWMAAYFRARLVRALGREDAVALLCRRPARVMLTLTHVDVTFALDHHPIELRMAGLDRDLGWIPAAGRYVAFHFE